MLPTIEHPTSEVELLVTGKKVLMRPMTIKEEKMLLMAQESTERLDSLRAIVQILSNCVSGVLIHELPSYNIEWLFIKLRAMSVSEVLKMEMTYEEKQYPFEIKLNDIEPTMPEGKAPSREIKVNDKIKLILRHTPISAGLADMPSDELMSHIVAESIESVWNGDKEVKPTDHNELRNWVNTLPAEVFVKIEEFVNHVPRIRHEQKVHVGKEEPEVVRFETLYDFFML